jgi:hypothetical protein
MKATPRYESLTPALLASAGRDIVEVIRALEPARSGTHVIGSAVAVRGRGGDTFVVRATKVSSSFPPWAPRPRLRRPRSAGFAMWVRNAAMADGESTVAIVIQGLGA